MEYFVDKESVVRQIWGKGDTILFIFAGAAAEFALSKAVDWLYFTGRLPNDPLGRLFSTVSYARTIVFSEKQAALRAIDAMTAIHANVEAKRGSAIPDWAYRDVLFMLIDYSIRSFEILERKLTTGEKREVFRVFTAVGIRMGLKGLPASYEEWLLMRKSHLEANLQLSIYTNDLFKQYKKHLGLIRFVILKEAQTLVTPRMVANLLGLRKTSFFQPVITLYKATRSLRLDWLLKAAILPARYKKAIEALDTAVA
jgi:hypothetical protein